MKAHGKRARGIKDDLGNQFWFLIEKKTKWFLNIGWMLYNFFDMCWCIFGAIFVLMLENAIKTPALLAWHWAMAATAAIMYSLAEHFHCIDDTSIVIAFTWKRKRYNSLCWFLYFRCCIGENILIFAIEFIKWIRNDIFSRSQCTWLQLYMN